MFALGQRPVMRVNPGNDLVAQIRVIAARRRRVQELASTERCPAVHPHYDAWWCLALCEQLVNKFWKVLSERCAVAPHIKLPGEALDLVDGRVASAGLLIVVGGEVDPQGPLVRVSQGIAF